MSDGSPKVARRHRVRRVAAVVRASCAAYVATTAAFLLWFSAGMARFDDESLPLGAYVVFGVVPLCIAAGLLVVAVRHWRGRRLVPAFR